MHVCISLNVYSWASCAVFTEKLVSKYMKPLLPVVDIHDSKHIFIFKAIFIQLLKKRLFPVLNYLFSI